MAKKGYSKEARRNASIARSIKQLLGTAAYEAYKSTGQYNKSALDAARRKKLGPEKQKRDAKRPKKSTRGPEPHEAPDAPGTIGVVVEPEHRLLLRRATGYFNKRDESVAARQNRSRISKKIRAGAPLTREEVDGLADGVRAHQDWLRKSERGSLGDFWRRQADALQPSLDVLDELQSDLKSLEAGKVPRNPNGTVKAHVQHAMPGGVDPGLSAAVRAGNAQTKAERDAEARANANPVSAVPDKPTFGWVRDNIENLSDDQLVELRGKLYSPARAGGKTNRMQKAYLNEKRRREGKDPLEFKEPERAAPGKGVNLEDNPREGIRLRKAMIRYQGQYDRGQSSIADMKQQLAEKDFDVFDEVSLRRYIKESEERQTKLRKKIADTEAAVEASFAATPQAHLDRKAAEKGLDPSVAAGLGSTTAHLRDVSAPTEAETTSGSRRAASLFRKIGEFDDPNMPEDDIEKLQGRAFALQRIDQSDIEIAVRGLYPDQPLSDALESAASRLDSRNNTLLQRMHNWADFHRAKGN